MTSSYENIYSKFLGLIETYDFLELSKTDAYEMMSEWFEGVIARPKFRKLFKTISWDNEVLQLNYELKNSVDEQSDKAFVEYMMANGMVIGWLAPRALNNDLLLKQMYGTKETNFFSQANHVTAIQEIVDKAYKVLDKDYIRDYGYGYYVMNGELN